MKKILFINHRGSRCGVHQYGLRVYETIKDTAGYAFIYAECSGREELLFLYQKFLPEIIIYNYFRSTSPFIDKELLHSIPRAIHVCWAHEFSQKKADQFQPDGFHYVVFGDPHLVERNPHVFSIGRLLSDYTNTKPVSQIPLIGSCGFGGFIKGYVPLIRLVEDSFEEAIIRINIPPNSQSDPSGNYAKIFYEKTQKEIKNPGIRLQVTNRFFSHRDLLDFLAENTVNVFLYDPVYTGLVSKGGLSSMVDEAISVKRPVAVSESHLFRHLFSFRPSIVLKFQAKRSKLWHKVLDLKDQFNYPRKVEYTNLQTIISQGTAPLEPLYQEWSVERFQSRFASILSRVEEKEQAKLALR